MSRVPSLPHQGRAQTELDWVEVLGELGWAEPAKAVIMMMLRIMMMVVVEMVIMMMMMIELRSIWP